MRNLVLAVVGLGVAAISIAFTQASAQTVHDSTDIVDANGNRVGKLF
jgi:hypothetical protein